MLSLVLILALAARVAPAFAQSAIAGTVRDSSGAAIEGVAVEASSLALIEKVRSAVTDSTGQYRIEDLRPASMPCGSAFRGGKPTCSRVSSLPDRSRRQLMPSWQLAL